MFVRLALSRYRCATGNNEGKLKEDVFIHFIFDKGLLMAFQTHIFLLKGVCLCVFLHVLSNVGVKLRVTLSRSYLHAAACCIIFPFTGEYTKIQHRVIVNFLFSIMAIMEN